MCGIVGYIGEKQAKNILLEGMRRMEYRGYDSAGIAVSDGNSVTVLKKAGKLDGFIPIVESADVKGIVGIGHIRWATHGVPNDTNAHPHRSSDGTIYVVHNGIVENWQPLKEQLTRSGYSFFSQTDTEVLANYISMHHQRLPLEEAVRLVMKEIKGTYGIAVISTKESGTIVAARSGSPLIIGIINDDEYMIASDATSLLPYTRTVVYLKEREIAILSRKSFSVKSISNKIIVPQRTQISWDIKEAEKGGFQHFMLKEIMEQPEVIENCLRANLSIINDGRFINIQRKFKNIDRIVLLACGSAAYAGIVGEYMIEEYTRIPTKVEIGSEFRYRKPIINKNTCVVAISQSGETADTIASLYEAKQRGALTLGIVNVIGSTIARDVDTVIPINAGPEIAVASTKALVGMLATLALLAVCLGRSRGMSKEMEKSIIKELLLLPNNVSKILKRGECIKKIAEIYAHYDHAYFLGRKYNYGIAREGAQKLKEVSYVHAEGYHSGELKHGPLATVDERFFSFFIMPEDSVYEKNVSNLEELKARNGNAIAITTEGNKKLSLTADDIITIPKTIETLYPILTVVPLQLFAYYTAVFKGLDVDKPRNLAKSVTVE